MADFTSGLQWAKSSEIARTCPRRPCVFQTVGVSSGEPVEGELDSKWTKSLSTKPRDRTTPLLRKFTEDERKRRRSFERKDNSVPLAGSVKYIAPGTSWSVQFHFREKGKEVNFSCFGREFMELLMNIPLTFNVCYSLHWEYWQGGKFGGRTFFGIFFLYYEPVCAANSLIKQGNIEDA